MPEWQRGFYPEKNSNHYQYVPCNDLLGIYTAPGGIATAYGYRDKAGFRRLIRDPEIFCIVQPDPG